MSRIVRPKNLYKTPRPGARKIKLSRLVFWPFLFFISLLCLELIARKYRETLLGKFSVNYPDELPVSNTARDQKINGIIRIKGSLSMSTAMRGAIVHLPEAFSNILYRAKETASRCQELHPLGFEPSHSVAYYVNETLAALPAFGVIEAIENYVATEADEHWRCVNPPRKECSETKFSVIFMAYNPERLRKTLNQIQTLLEGRDWKDVVHECVIVWNGEHSLLESVIGNKTLGYAANRNNSLRIVYPLKMGLPNDLMNRYHPDVVKPQTKALLFYDDDGPFYSFEAVTAGFELWKQHSSAQVGAMSREISLGERQRLERENILQRRHHDRFFVSHCDNLEDHVEYNFRYFANFDANMVLPSGSFLHSGYLCFIWHPVLEPIRKFVQLHPTHPDDITVSMIVSQLAGRAPRVYSRKLLVDKTQKLRNIKNDQLVDHNKGHHQQLQYLPEEPPGTGILPIAQQTRRKLLFDIEWDVDNKKMTSSKKMWAALRTQATNSLVRYFGSLNSGSIGWCDGTRWYSSKVGGKCDPIMAHVGWLPWMNESSSSNSLCRSL